MKRIILLSDFNSPEYNSFIIRNATSELLRLDSELRVLDGGVVKTDESKFWSGEQSKVLVNDLRKSFPYPKFSLLGVLLNKSLFEWVDDPELTYGFYHNSNGEHAFTVSCLRSLKGASAEDCYRTVMHEIGESKGLGHHNNPDCFMHDPYIHSKKNPIEFCPECIERSKSHMIFPTQ